MMDEKGHENGLRSFGLSEYEESMTKRMGSEMIDNVRCIMKTDELAICCLSIALANYVIPKIFCLGPGWV